MTSAPMQKLKDLGLKMTSIPSGVDIAQDAEDA